GVVENVWGVSLGMLALAGLLTGGRPVGAWRMAGLAVLAALAGGTHELFGVLMIAGFAGGTVLAHRRGLPNRGAWLVVTAAVILGTVVVVAAPGNAARMAVSNPQPHYDKWWWKFVFRMVRGVYLG